jgi:hypothetical protein
MDYINITMTENMKKAVKYIADKHHNVSMAQLGRALFSEHIEQQKIKYPHLKNRVSINAVEGELIEAVKIKNIRVGQDMW